MTLEQEQAYDAIDRLADEDPIALRDLAWKLLDERDVLDRQLTAAVNATDRAHAEVERHRDAAMGLVAKAHAAEAERDAMLPVVEAAEACVVRLKASVARAGESEWLRDETRALIAAVDALAPTTVAAGGPESNADTANVGAHRYTSTACHHGHHRECATGGTRWDGTIKTPAQCKYCDARCECPGCDHKALVMDGDQPGRG